MSALLEVNDLRAGYGRAEVLQGLSFSAAENSVVTVIGPNGAGKSTLLGALMGLIPSRSAALRFAGEDITGMDSAGVVRRGLIHVPEGRRIFPNMSVRDNLELGSYLRATANRGRNIEHVVSIFPRLKERFSQLAGTLSGGEQQMLAIGRGLMGEPELLIMDEPSLGLSPLLVEEMFALIGKLNAEGQSILLMEQNAVQTLAIAHRAYIIENGQIAMKGKAADMLGDPQLRKNYLGL